MEKKPQIQSIMEKNDNKRINTFYQTDTLNTLGQIIHFEVKE